MDVVDDEQPMYLIGCVRGKVPYTVEGAPRWLCCDCTLVLHPDGSYTPNIWVLRKEYIYHTS
jgi:hypothetical protein